MTTKHFILALCSLLTVFACSKNEPAPIDEPSIPVESVEEVLRMNNTLAWALFQEEQGAKSGENILISPWSIQTAINMALNGASDETRAELLKFLDCTDCAVEDINALQANLRTLLEKQSGHPTLTSVNAFFYDKARMTVKTDFLQSLETHYKCENKELDFNAETQSLQTINGFVKNGTNGKIDKILSKINAEDVAFLINALHFKADWQVAFAPESTFERDFKKTDGTVSKVDFVSGDRNFVTFTKDKFRGVDLPLLDSTYSVTLIQPADDNKEPNWSQTLSTDAWKDFFVGTTNDRAIVNFPKLKLSYENDLITSLQRLGVEKPFSPSAADFSAMGTGIVGNIYIGQIVHKAVLDMDEKGVEGAAVTSIGFAQTSLPPVFQFDAPYVLTIRHIATNTILFIGFVADPAF